jgi:hypothetical protein
MADVYEKNLGSKTSLTMNDFIRVVGSNNVSYKQLVSDVADKIITTYAGATLAGSEQSVKDAIDGLNSDKQPKTMSKTVAGQTTVEGAISKLNSDKQPKTMSKTIGGQTTVEGCLSSLNSKLSSLITFYHTTYTKAVSVGQSWFETGYSNIDPRSNKCIISVFCENPNVVVGYTWFNNKVCITYYSSANITDLVFHFSIAVFA